jgi:hypothetical protein
MASSYSTDLKLELMVTGENAGTWGDNTNNNLNLIQQAIAGYEAVALSDGGTVALAMTDKTISNARNMVIKFTGTLTTASTVTIPDSIEKFYIFDLSAVTGVTNLTIKTVSGSGFTAGEAAIVAAYSDGTDLNEIALNTLGGTIATAQIDDNAITTAKISDNQITTAKISDNQITTAKISDNQITTAKISDNQVTADKLDDVLTDSGGTAGAYTTADITVDAQGRITAVATGSAGGGGFIPTKLQAGPASGTFTAQGNYVSVYMWAGGGGNGGRSAIQPPAQGNGGTGGVGGFGIFQAPVASPFAQPFQIGAGGTDGQTLQFNGNPGNAGQSTFITNIGTANAGNGGNGGSGTTPGNPGTNGSAPGSAFTINRTHLTGVNYGSSPTVGYMILYENIGS